MEMKGFLFFIFIIQLKICFYSKIPLWNFENTAVEINLPVSFQSHYQNPYNIEISITKTFKLEENKVIQENNVKIKDNNKNKNYDFKTEWDDVESFIEYSNIYYICPKGGYYIFTYNANNNERNTLNPGQEIEKSGFELKCYYLEHRDTLFVAYTFIKKKSLYNYYLKLNNHCNNREIAEGFLDFKFRDKDYEKSEFEMIGLIFHNDDIYLNYIIITLQYEKDKFDPNFSGLPEREVCKGLTHSKAYFNDENKNFYFITYNNTALFSGYSEKNVDINKETIESINIIKNESPFIFYDDIEILSVDFIKNKKYVYYQIRSNNEEYYGIIDIEKNTIIYNTNQSNIEFKALSNSEILVISDSKVYKICTLMENDKCVYECSQDNKMVIDYQNITSCNSTCSSYILNKENICIPTCDEEIYISNNSECGFCAYMEEKKPYKFINGSKCLEEIPPKAKLYSEQYFLLICEDGYNLVNDTCKKCYERCKDCENESDNPEDQQCTSCNDDYFLQNGNCIEKCSDNYFVISEKICSKCDDSCKTCIEKSNKCTSCQDHKYLDSQSNCKDCDPHCLTCTKGPENDNHNCESCDNSTKYKYFYENGNNHLCVEKCPDNTNENNNNFTCIPKGNNNNENNDNKNNGNSESSPDYMLWIFIIIIALILLIISLCICKKYCSKKSDSNLIEDIHNELDDKEMTN